MAEFEEEIEEEGGDDGGGNKLLVILSVVNVVGMIGIGVYLALFAGSGQQMTPEQMAENAAGAGKDKPPAGLQAEPGPMYEIGNLVINLREPGGDRFLKTKIQLELDAQESQPEVEQRVSQIRYQLNALLSGQRVADVSGPENMEALRKKMQRRVNTVMTNGKIVAVWPTEWIVQ